MYIDIYTKKAKNVRSALAFAPWIVQWRSISAAEENVMFAVQGGFEVCSPGTYSLCCHGFRKYMRATILSEEHCFHILFLIFPEVIKINITCPRGLKVWARNVTHCLSLCCGGHPRERVSVCDDSSQNFSWWSAKLWSLDFLGSAYLGCRPKPVPTFTLAPPVRISLWFFFEESCL